MTSPWQLWLLWGFAIGIGTGSLALVFGAVVANRWFVKHRGVVIGVFSAASSTGQLVFLPAIAHLADGPGWRWAARRSPPSSRLLLVPLRAGGCCATTRATSARRRTAPAGPTPRPAAADARSAARVALGALRENTRSRTFWILFGTFWICGWSTNGLIGTHFIPAAHDHGMPATTSAGLLALIGIFDIVGTVASGWLTDRVDSRYLLCGYYFFRGLSLLGGAVAARPARPPEPVPVHPVLRPRLGGDRAADGRAVPRSTSGSRRPASSSAGCSPAHMVGAGVAASFAGWIREWRGDYFGAWLTAGGALPARGVACLLIPRRPVTEVA